MDEWAKFAGHMADTNGEDAVPARGREMLVAAPAGSRFQRARIPSKKLPARAMDGIGPEIALAVKAACEAHALDIAAAFSRALDTPLLATVGNPLPCGTEPLPDECNGPGLVMPFKIGKQAGVACLAESSGLLPAWYAQPDVNGAAKLGTLAEELSILLFPDDLVAERTREGRVANLTAWLQRSGPSASAVYLPLHLSAGARQGTLYVLWPIANAAVDAGPATTAPRPSPAAPGAAPKPSAQPAPRPMSAAPPTLDRLPAFSRSLLHIKVPVIVTLANKKQPVNKIVELLPGSIIQFNKSCEEMLELEVSGQPIAEGECVKVGDKFGLRVTSLILPGERFETIPPDTSAGRGGSARP